MWASASEHTMTLSRSNINNAVVQKLQSTGLFLRSLMPLDEEVVPLLTK